MDEVSAFFDFSTPGSKVTKLKAPMTSGFRITKEDSLHLLDKREEHRHSVIVSGTDYAREIREKAKETYMLNMRDQGPSTYDSRSSGLESMERLSSFVTSIPNIDKLTDEAMNEVYKKYSFQMRETNYLPINDYKQEIMDGVTGFPVTIIEGPTGCGKTTQVPQWILDHCYEERKPCKIVVTQPRRIAAISIAKRVAHERGWDVGGVVGYQVGLDSKISSDTRITYVTTGVLLQKIVANKTLNEYTHIILDEVHERGQEMDFLMLLVRKLVYTVSKQVHVVLMSATLNKIALTNYFVMPCFVSVSKKEPMYSVKTFYLNQLTKFHEATSMKDEPGIPPEMYHLVIKLLKCFESNDMQEDKYDDRDSADLPAVLIFLPGINEIEELFMALNDTKLKEQLGGVQCANFKWTVLPLHSTITADEQARVFQRSPPGHRKIILSTNIAESSITVPDIKYVIDFCLMKMLVADKNTNFTSLQLCWASKSNCEQRAGRAGRVRDGRVYRLVNVDFYEKLPDESPPEIQRCPLERLVLLAKMLDVGPPSEVLALAMDPPDMSNIHRTILVLKEIGALKKTFNGEWEATDGDITYLGRVMAKLPLDVRASKLIVLGHIYGCLEEAIVMAAAMSVKSIFSSPFRQRLNAYSSKLTWADGSTSDSIALYNVYKVWVHLRQQQDFKQGNSVHQWAHRFFVQVRALRELDDLVKELKIRLSREGIEVDRNPSPWNKNEQTLALKIILAGAMYPQYFVQVKQDESREREAVRAVGGLDPRDTVYLKNFPEHQPPEVYRGAIRSAVRACIDHEPRVTFDTNSRKVFLTFEDESKSRRRERNTNDPTIPGQVVLPVYKAVKARMLKMDIRIPLLPVEKANALAKTLQMEHPEIDTQRLVPRLPDIDDSHFPLKICELISISRFWVQYDDESTVSELRNIQLCLNTRKLLSNTTTVAVGDVYAAPYVDASGTTIHRARVTKILPRGMVEVLYIDYGSVSSLNVSNLYCLPEGECVEVPPLAMRCRLAEIAPSPLLNHHGQWTDAAVRCFNDLVSKGHLLAKVYSVTHGVVAIELLANGGRVNINQELLKRQYAIPSEESYDSKMNHDLRETASELNLAQKRAFSREQASLALGSTRDAAPPSRRDCVSDVCLQGAYSPLESNIHNLMYAGRDKVATIEWNSVNSVILDTEPQEVYERLVIAAEVGQNEMSSKLTLRHTTLMPNLPGLPAIIALLFCPTAELRRDASGARYVSALCGLGGSEGGAPYFPEHDLLVAVDADLAVDDVGTINHIRHLMDYMLFCGEGQDMPAENEFHKQVPRTIRTDILALFSKRRKHREPQSVENAWEWNSIPQSDLLEITRPEMVEGEVIYPLHTPQELYPLTPEQMVALKKENEELKIAVSRSSNSSSKLLSCKLCNTLPMAAQAMRIHLYSNAHKEKEDDLRAVDS